MRLEESIKRAQELKNNTGNQTVVMHPNIGKFILFTTGFLPQIFNNVPTTTEDLLSNKFTIKEFNTKETEYFE